MKPRRSLWIPPLTTPMLVQAALACGSSQEAASGVTPALQPPVLAFTQATNTAPPTATPAPIAPPESSPIPFARMGMPSWVTIKRAPQEMIHGPWDDDFVTARPGDTLSYADFKTTATATCKLPGLSVASMETG